MSTSGGTLLKGHALRSDFVGWLYTDPARLGDYNEALARYFSAELPSWSAWTVKPPDIQRSVPPITVALSRRSGGIPHDIESTWAFENLYSSVKLLVGSSGFKTRVGLDQGCRMTMWSLEKIEKSKPSQLSLTEPALGRPQEMENALYDADPYGLDFHEHADHKVCAAGIRLDCIEAQLLAHDEHYIKLGACFTQLERMPHPDRVAVRAATAQLEVSLRSCAALVTLLELADGPRTAVLCRLLQRLLRKMSASRRRALAARATELAELQERARRDLGRAQSAAKVMALCARLADAESRGRIAAIVDGPDPTGGWLAPRLRFGPWAGADGTDAELWKEACGWARERYRAACEGVERSAEEACKKAGARRAREWMGRRSKCAAYVVWAEEMRAEMRAEEMWNEEMLAEEWKTLGRASWSSDEGVWKEDEEEKACGGAWCLS